MRQVGRTDPIYSAGKQIGTHVRARAERGKPAARPAHGRDAFRIGDALIDRPFHGVEEIFLRAASPLVSPGIQKFSPKPVEPR